MQCTDIYNRERPYQRVQLSLQSVEQISELLNNMSLFEGSPPIGSSVPSYLEDVLWDRFVCGLRSEEIQKCLLLETDLTLPRATELAQGMASADCNTWSFQGTEPANKGLSGLQLQGKVKQHPCSRCGKTNYTAPKCRFKDAE